MKKVLSLLLLVLAYLPVYSCTTFFISRDGQLVFGRNYDWITDAGMVCTNLKSISKTSMPTQHGSTISWVSKYGSVTFNQYGKEFPTGGMNEKGLVVELMWLDETRYPSADERPAVGVLQWIQYQLDNCSTIDEVIATDKKLRIAAIGTTPLHYLIADTTGNAATIEFLDGKMVVHKGNDLSIPVLTNSIYAESVKTFNKIAATAGTTPFADGNNSLERFEQACNMVKQFKAATNVKPATDYAFDILSKVAQGSFTKWSIVYDLTNKKVLFKTERFNDIKTVSFSAFDFNCTATAKAWDMNQMGPGDVSRKFENFTLAGNQRLVETAFLESKSQIHVSEKIKESVWQYPNGMSCR